MTLYSVAEQQAWCAACPSSRLERVPGAYHHLCRHCKHAEGRASMLAGRIVVWCALHRTVPVRVCGDWERVPGGDGE